jgi:hypothetical protein
MIKKDKFNDPMFLVLIWMFIGFINGMIENVIVSYILGAIAFGLFLLAVVKYFRN